MYLYRQFPEPCTIIPGLAWVPEPKCSNSPKNWVMSPIPRPFPLSKKNIYYRCGVAQYPGRIFSQAISGIESAAVLNNYTILFGQSYDDMEIEKKWWK